MNRQLVFVYRLMRNLMMCNDAESSDIQCILQACGANPAAARFIAIFAFPLGRKPLRMGAVRAQFIGHAVQGHCFRLHDRSSLKLNLLESLRHFPSIDNEITESHMCRHEYAQASQSKEFNRRLLTRASIRNGECGFQQPGLLNRQSMCKLGLAGTARGQDDENA